jgi:hypothetical protein
MPEAPIILIKMKPDGSGPDVSIPVESSFNITQYLTTWANEAHSREMVMEVVVGFAPMDQYFETEEEPIQEEYLDEQENEDD